ncbi:hypothetical protein DXG01_001319 [Tephrocybe rancida]|nr:hypothetical protein DXG01_001319 [Tephrocybe rancida]
MASIRYMVTLWLAFDFAVDFYIAITLIVLLLKSRTGFQRSNSVIYRLVGAAIQTEHLSDDESTTAPPGFFAAIFSAAGIVVYLKYPTTRYYAIIGLAIARVYSIVSDLSVCHHGVSNSISTGQAVMDALLVRHSLREEIKGGRTPTSALRQLEELGSIPGIVTPSKCPAGLQSPVIVMK